VLPGIAQKSRLELGRLQLADDELVGSRGERAGGDLQVEAGAVGQTVTVLRERERHVAYTLASSAALAYTPACPVEDTLLICRVMRSPGRTTTLPASPRLLANSPVLVARSVGLLAAVPQIEVPLTSTSPTVLPAPVPAVTA